MATATRIIYNAKTKQSVTETYEIPDPTPEEIAAEAARQKRELIKRYEQAVQAHLDQEAQINGYDNIMSACSYAAVPNAFQAESQAFIEWRSNCWTTCHAVMADAEAGNIAVPTESELIAMLPVFGS